MPVNIIMEFVQQLKDKAFVAIREALDGNADIIFA